MKKSLIKTLFLTSMILSTNSLFVFSSCSNNPQPIKTPKVSINDDDKISFLYDTQPSYTFNLNLENFYGSEVIYLRILNQKKNDIEGEYVKFVDSQDGPFIKTFNVVENQKTITVKITSIDPISSHDNTGQITFDLGFTVLKNGKNVLNSEISGFSLYFAHPVPNEAFITETESSGKVRLLGFDLEKYSDEILASDLLVIPSNITHIDDNAFFKNQQSTIPNNIKWLVFSSSNGYSPLIKIGDNAFKNAPFQNQIEFPPILEYIGASAFENCTNIVGNVVFPQWVETIGAYAFRCCSNITGIQFEGIKLQSINDYVFENCTSLTSINEIPPFISFIGSRAFSNCSNLESKLHIPITVKYIGSYAFNNCSKIESIQFDSPEYSNLQSIYQYAFYNSNAGPTFVMPYSLTYISDYAFAKSGIYSIIFNNNLEYLGKSAFVDNHLYLIDASLLKLKNLGDVTKWYTTLVGDPFVGTTTDGILMSGGDENIIHFLEQLQNDTRIRSLIYWIIN